jgi:hypothetical protein
MYVEIIQCLRSPQGKYLGRTFPGNVYHWFGDFAPLHLPRIMHWTQLFLRGGARSFKTLSSYIITYHLGKRSSDCRYIYV